MKVIDKLDFTALNKAIVKDLTANVALYENLYKSYDKEDIKRFLETPSRYEKQLREISNFLYGASLHYSNVVEFFGDLLLYAYIVTGYRTDDKKIKKKEFEQEYMEILFKLDNMNFKHEFNKIMLEVFKEEVFYGYVHETEDSFYIQKLNPQACQVSSVEDGVLLFSFDFATITDRNLHLYPKELQNKYKKYKNDRKLKWQELDGENTICIKFNENVSYSVPPLAGTFESVADIWEYKELKRAKTNILNYKLIGLGVPLRKDSNEADNMALSVETVTHFMNLINSSLPEGIGAFVSPMDIIPIDFKEENNTKDRVEEAIKGFYNDSGINQLLFNSDRSTGASLLPSIERASTIAYRLLRQFERWVNKRLKIQGNDIYRFKVSFLDVTHYNKEKEYDKYMKMMQYGTPVIMQAMACLGYSPLDLINNNILQVDILSLVDKLKPPITSNTLSGKETGRTKKDDGDLTDAGSATRETGANDEGNRV